ncbi:periplasmic solute binding protein [Ammonifex degensii KC4]|uniref:Periplasmic solute binding protein n=1 Tax=Ammonifex degensii (strain DSM 10501 / KC4) TaxID=429009 RepID=C9R7P7_AMMDK|nr:metal ABC transporter substrate-binding protein [Ammonifex degensii]ACX52326.1 periplasmic solute binding protein [Ammonifex degensii KC4]
MKRWLVLGLIVSLVALAGCGASAPTTQEKPAKLSVVATFFPLADFARQVGGDRVEVTCLVPPGVSVHDWEPSPGDLTKIMQSELFIYNGAGLEPWVDKVLPEYKGKPVEAVKGIKLLTFAEVGGVEGEDHHHYHGEVDPHAWLDPVNAQQYVKNILEGLLAVDPQGADYYRQRVEAYEKKLQELDKAYREAAAHFRHREIVVSHAAFGYLAHRYGLKQIPIAGLSPQAEPSPAKLAELVRLIKGRHVKYVFFESPANPRVAETLAREAGVKALVLNPVAGLTPEEKSGAKGYLEVMQDNLKVLQQALGD